MHNVIKIFIRYLFILLVGLFGFYYIYSFFTPLTLYPSYYIIRLFYPDALLSGTEIFVGAKHLTIIPACIAGAAYYLLFALNLSTPMSTLRRIKSILFIILVFLILNILRIAIFAKMYIESSIFFDFAHLSVWYIGSTFLVVAIWFINVKLFDIKDTPIYSDFKSIYSYIK